MSSSSLSQISYFCSVGVSFLEQNVYRWRMLSDPCCCDSTAPMAKLGQPASTTRSLDRSGCFNICAEMKVFFSCSKALCASDTQLKSEFLWQNWGHSGEFLDEPLLEICESQEALDITGGLWQGPVHYGGNFPQLHTNPIEWVDIARKINGGVVTHTFFQFDEQAIFPEAFVKCAGCAEAGFQRS